MSESIEDRFQTLHEIVKAARVKLNRDAWDYLVGGAETETTLARNRLALDSLAFRPRVLRDVSKIDTTASLFGKPLRMPVLMAPVGALQMFEPGGAGAVGEAAHIFGNGMMVSSGTLPLSLAKAREDGRVGPGDKVLMIGLAAGIIFDATVIRALLVPSLMRLMGEWNWWMPRPAARLLFLRPDEPAAATES